MPTSMSVPSMLAQVEEIAVCVTAVHENSSFTQKLFQRNPF